MKYAIITIIILVILCFAIFFFLKKTSSDGKDIDMPDTTPPSSTLNKTPVYKEEYTIDNPNPDFQVELKDFKHAQLGINRATKNEGVYFKVTKKNRIDVFTLNKQYLGQILVKDYKDFSLISQKPEYFEGEITSFIRESYSIKKVIITLQVKSESSKEVYKLDKSYLNTLITLPSLFTIGQIVETNYGPSTILKVYEDHLLVEVPSLGNREIYDIDPILSSN